jgi:hypothetical protein
MVRKVPVALEVGAKRSFASALAWPGWCRAGRDEDAALDALVSYGSRYATVVDGAVRGFTAPRSSAGLEVVERLPGNASTDFGAPGVPPNLDAAPLTTRDLRRLEAVLVACWNAFDRVAEAGDGHALRVGPRGGGRDLPKIRRHVLEAELAYLRSLGGSVRRGADVEQARAAFLEAVDARASGELPDVGPRGGARWSARYAIRRSAWHTLDHAWEIEDRVVA